MEKPTTLPVPETPKKVFKKIPGQFDFLPEDYREYDFLIHRLDNLAASFGFAKVEPALFEEASVVKNFKTEEGQPAVLGSAVMRHSALPGILRMYIENKVAERERVSKWYYLTPVVVQLDNPYQLVSTWEYGFEVFGEESGVFDAQVLALAWKLYSSLADNIVLEIGSRGCENCWPEYRETLTRSLSPAKYSLCKNCAAALEKNPERILTCNEPDCQTIAADAPAFIDYLDQACSNHLTLILESLDELGVPYVLNTFSDGEENTKRTTFRFKFNHPQDSFILSRGSRHDNLFNHYNQTPTPALGLRGDFGKLVRAWRLQGAEMERLHKNDVALIPLGELASKKALPLFSDLWDRKISVINLLGENSLKLRLLQAQELKIPLALIVGQKEALDGTVILRDVKSGMQEVFAGDRIIDEVRKRLGEL